MFMNDQPKNNNKAALSAKIQKQSKKAKPKNKAVVQQVIDLQVQSADKNGTTSGLFMTQLVKKCNSFFTWISNTQSPLLAQQLWKNKMQDSAAARFPQLSFYEISKLVERDWRYMSEEDRAGIAQKQVKLPDQEELGVEIGSYLLPQLQSQ